MKNILDLRKLEIPILKKEIDNLNNQLFNIRIKKELDNLEKTSELKFIRRQISRIKTIISEKEKEKKSVK